MKKLIIIFLCSFIGMQLKAQEVSEKEVPSVILNAFYLEFKEAKDVEWEIQDESYKAEFEIKGKEQCAWLDSDGTIRYTGFEIKEKELPPIVKQTIARTYNGYEIDDLVKISKDNSILYAVELEKDKQEITVFFSEDGNAIN